ncbi:Myeloid leukemia factor 1 [Liparis tanakae]|uniref:Myeloid leukemia factor 1 n=1 Tax=Liparis tanakae TaxID=230148 RepID=A0A4Z2FCT1_9TELE|nr:Myeloid leukemia factor 1 [Liparis tanakae]
MFNSNRREFDEDPFFSDPFQAHREHMRQMMRSFSEPYGGAPIVPSITDGRNCGLDLSENRRGENRDASRSLMPFGSIEGTEMTRNPFSVFDNMMSSRRNRMHEMHKNFIKETQQAVKDSETGLEKMSIAHHIQDRGHVVEKKYNKKTGEKELSQDFNNMDESEAQSFDDEWQQEVSKFRPLGPMLGLEQPGPRVAPQEALTGAEQEPSDQSKGEAEGTSDTKGSGSTKQ